MSGSRNTTPSGLSVPSPTGLVRTSLLVLISLLVALVTPLGVTAASAQTSLPSIVSDKDDYAPGELVTLTGAGWQPGESVHINVDDDQTKSWKRDVDVAADSSGSIMDSFNLPDWFVATYKVTATGAASGVATAGFTDGNVQVSTNNSGPSVQLDWSIHSANGCTGGSRTSSGTALITPTSGNVAGLSGDTGSFRLTVPNPSADSRAFTTWSGDSTATVNSVCVAARNSTQRFVANYAAVVAKTNQTITFAQPTSPQAYGNSFSIAPAASSGLPVTVVASGGCTVAAATPGYTVTMTSSTTSCVLTASQAGNASWNAAPSVERTVVAAKRPVTVTADAAGKTYGGIDPALTHNLTSGSLLPGDALSGAITRAAGEAAGAYAIARGTLAAPVNYELTYVAGTFTIAPRPITVTPAAAGKTYGAADPTLTYAVTAGSLVGADGFTGALTRAPGEAVGPYAITQGALTAGGNYVLTVAPATFTIAARALTITADPKNKTYGDPDPVLTWSITGGSLQAGDSVSGSLARVSGEDVGTRAITQGTLAVNGNYALTFAGAELTITARPVTVTAAAKSKVYGDVDPALTYTVPDGWLIGTDAFTGSLSRVAGEGVGTRAVQLGTLALSSNYSLTFVGADLTITARPVTVTADGKSRAYGDDEPALTSDITAGSLAFSDGFSGSLTRAAGGAVGTYAIQQGSLALSANYALTFVGADLTITPRAITVTADATSKVYGAVDPALTAQVTLGNLVGGDVLTGSLTRDAGEAVGSYGITLGTLTAGANYALTYQAGTLTIGTRAVEVTADAKSKTYGETDPALTFSVTSGELVEGDEFVGSLTRVAGEDVGSYAIEQGTVALSGNYALTYQAGTLTIGTRAVEVTADAKSKTYGETDPALTYTVPAGSLVGTDAFTGGLTRAPGENVGTHAIGQGTLKLSSNYTLSFIGADLTITARPVTATADGKSKVYGNTDPALTYKVPAGSLVGTDAFTGGLARQAGENVGTYAISRGSLALSSNYALSFVGANLTITQAPLTIKADDKTRLLGAANPTLTGTITGTKGSDAVGASYSTTATAASPVGTYPIVPAATGDVAVLANYAVTLVNGTLTVQFGWNGFLQPINDTAHQVSLTQSKFRLGQTIPAKFVITDAAGKVVQQATSPTFSRSGNRGSCDSSAQLESLATLDPAAGSTYRWDGSQYHYNWSTKGLTSGVYRIYANLADGTQRWVDICLTK